jgi:hypothetical protein
VAAWILPKNEPWIAAVLTNEVMIGEALRLLASDKSRPYDF